jgi:hypothetical protein
MSANDNSDKKNNLKNQNTNAGEVCAKCSGKIVYRKSSYFGNKVYYKVCNECGWYELLEFEEWEKGAFESKKNKEKE